MKRFLSAALVLALSLGLVSCTSDLKEDIYQDDTNVNSLDETNNAEEEQVSEESEASEVAKIA